MQQSGSGSARKEIRVLSVVALPVIETSALPSLGSSGVPAILRAYRPMGRPRKNDVAMRGKLVRRPA